MTTNDVMDIMDESVKEHHLWPFVNAATILVDKKLSGEGLDDDQLFEIERWLAAHMAAQSMQYRFAAKEKIGDVSVEYAGQFGSGLEATSYGQMVLTLDTTGVMRDLSKRKAWIYNVKE